MLFPSYLEAEAKDLIDKMLDLNPLNRLGAGLKGSDNDFRAIKAHPFFSGIDFNNLDKQRVPVPPVLLSQMNYRTGTVKSMAP